LRSANIRSAHPLLLLLLSAELVAHIIAAVLLSIYSQYYRSSV